MLFSECGCEGSGQQVEATRKRKWGGDTVGTGETEGEEGRGEEEEEREEAEEVEHRKKGEGGRSFLSGAFYLELGVLIVGREGAIWPHSVR